jgi:hypothetical protein
VCPASHKVNQAGTIPARFIAPTVSHAVLVGCASIMAATMVGIMHTEKRIVVGKNTSADMNIMKMAKPTEREMPPLFFSCCILFFFM